MQHIKAQRQSLSSVTAADPGSWLMPVTVLIPVIILTSKATLLPLFFVPLPKRQGDDLDLNAAYKFNPRFPGVLCKDKYERR